MNNFFQNAAILTSMVVLTACGGGASNDGSGPIIGQNGTVDFSSVAMPAGQTCNIPGFAQALVAEINAARAQPRNCGATPMPAAPAIGYWNTKLADASIRHSSDMAANGFYSHTGSDGSSTFDRVRAAGYRSGGSGEMLMRVTGRDTTNIRIWMNSWLSSDGHCRMLMDSDVKELGAACVRDGGTTYTTINFGG